MNRIFLNLVLAQLVFVALIFSEVLNASESKWSAIQPVWDRNKPPLINSDRPPFPELDPVHEAVQNVCVVSLAMFTMRGLTLNDSDGKGHRIPSARMAIVKGEKILKGLQSPSQGNSIYVLKQAAQISLGFGDQQPPFVVTELRRIHPLSPGHTQNQTFFEHQLDISYIAGDGNEGWFSGLPTIDFIEVIPLSELEDLLASPPYTLVETVRSPECSGVVGDLEDALNRNSSNLKFESGPIGFINHSGGHAGIDTN